MNKNELIGKRVMNNNSHTTGTIVDVEDNCVCVNFRGQVCRFPYPLCFSNSLELEDESLQTEIEKQGDNTSFLDFKNEYRRALNEEINYLKKTGGKKYRAIDGEIIKSKDKEYIYMFDTDDELHFQDGTVIKIQRTDSYIKGNILNCENFTIIISSEKYLGEKVDRIEFTAEQWLLLDALNERLSEMQQYDNMIAFEIACKSKTKVNSYGNIRCGQNYAINRAITEKITFIWGPPGTGKTYTLSKIVLEHMKQGKRVLMLSYSNVSVDGALLRVAKISDLPDGNVIRYGYPRSKEILESDSLSSFRYVLNKNPKLKEEYNDLLKTKNKLSIKSAKRDEINKRIGNIKKFLLESERELIQTSAFVATTVSKAVVDKAIYSQKFDVVIFDEASMAYVPQIVFSSSFAKSNFICLGDFCQLPAVVQNPENTKLMSDIFEYTNISKAVSNKCGHEWLVLLDTQYRMHYEIADFVSLYMYEGLLKTGEKIFQKCRAIASISPKEDEPIVLVDISDMYSVCLSKIDGDSRINIMSALICIRIAEQYIDKYEVGIITPYRAQARLIFAMIRDLRERDSRYNNIVCATVHQFQGSEKPVIIYDAVDCYRAKYVGYLLTSKKNDTANRLFNVALTRAKGKFILVANRDYFIRKHISKELMFTQCLKQISNNDSRLSGNNLIEYLFPHSENQLQVYVDNREESFEMYLNDLSKAKTEILIDMPSEINDDEGEMEMLIDCLSEKEDIKLSIRRSENLTLPKFLRSYSKVYPYVTTPISIIDKEIIWFGHPMFDDDFISEGSTIKTKYFPCFRFEGKYSARTLKNFLEL